MKTKLFTISFCLVAILFLGCDEMKPKQESSSIADSIEGLNFSETENYFVLAKNGLRVREEPDLSAEKIAIFKYGSKVQVIPTDAHDIKPVSGLYGAMVKGIQGKEKGYVFNGYLSSIPAPKEGQSPSQYVNWLKQKDYYAKYDEKEYDEGMELEEIFTIPARNFQEAFLIGQRVDIFNFDFDLPYSHSKELTYRNEKGETKKIALRTDDYDLDKSFILEELDNNYWFREVGFQYDGKEIMYLKVDAAYEGGSWSCTLEQNGDSYTFSKFSVAD